MSQAVPDNANLHQSSDRAPSMGPTKITKPGAFDSWTRAQLELRLKVARTDLQVEHAHFQHWKRELDKYNPGQYSLALLTGEVASEIWNCVGQAPRVASHDQDLVQKMLEASHRAVRRLENELWAMERRLEDVLSLMPGAEVEEASR